MKARGAPEILVVAGEASGDAHAAALVAALRKRRPELRFFGMVGPALRAQGVEPLYDAREISVMGLVEVLPKLWRITGILRALARAARARRPALAVLVDVPDFNLRLARRLKALGIPVVYYISPTVWAWREGRVEQIRRDVDRMLCILPFEPAFYAERGVEACYVGNPVVESLPEPGSAEQFRQRLGLAERPTVALLPGSRHGELRRIFPSLLDAAEELARERAELQFVVPVAPTLEPAELEPYLRGRALRPRLVRGRAAEAVGASELALVASGTAALEAGLMARPLVVVYRVSWLTYWVARLVLKVAHVSLINLLAGRSVVPELLQSAMSPRRIAAEARRLLDDHAARQAMVQGLGEVRALLGKPGAADRAAEQVLDLLDRPEG